jgi:hypothetical protein
MAKQVKKLDETQMLRDLTRALDALADASDATAGIRAVAAILTAARCARRADMPPAVAAAMIAAYIRRGDPV